MPFQNLPAYDAGDLSFGPGVIKIALAGTTPADDVGAVDVGMTLSHSVDPLDALQGTPRRIIASFRQTEGVTFAFTGLQWNLANLKKYLGGGTYAEGPPETFGFGGSLRYTEVSPFLQHNMPPAAGSTVGDTIEIRIWRARSAGDMPITFGEDLHNFPVTFQALDAGYEWGNDTCTEITGAERYYRMTRIVAPA